MFVVTPFEKKFSVHIFNVKFFFPIFAVKGKKSKTRQVTL